MVHKELTALKGAALIQDSCLHHVDHLAPYCELFAAPLLVFDEEKERLIHHYYPFLSQKRSDPIDMEPIELEKSYDFVFHSFFWNRRLLGEKLRAVYVPHGNSDKGHLLDNYMEKFQQQDIALLYGKKMIDFLKKKRVFSLTHQVVIAGNVRYLHFLHHRSHYEKIVEKEVLVRLDPKKKIILFAPTWEDWEQSSSFFEIVETLIAQLVPTYNLVIKPHPLLEINSPEKFYPLLGKMEGKEGVLFLRDFPLIYPLLEQVDIYLGDFSSIGYDFTIFEKPMFFFLPSNHSGKDSSCYLHRCGTRIPKEKYGDLLAFIEKKLSKDCAYRQTRKETYLHTFGPMKRLELVKSDLMSLLQKGKRK